MGGWEGWAGRGGARVRIGKLTIKFTWKCKGLTISKTIVKKNKIGAFIPSDFETCSKAAVIMAISTGKTYRLMD